ncbi:hypothetical protein SASPL_144409 [Salvia splendens]|uniref:Trichome birefringence-like C-terminal domain-containing protein n=1 Tax=Salvia splendens TaxID=180675 RepID=A0A8X8WFN0_SALSN|nr:hypothetical protein SASPL_144409 [Salvia splendens]
MRLKGMLILATAISVALWQSKANAEENKSCDLFEGEWLSESSAPYTLYNYASCPFIQKEFNCRKNGRSDDLYLRWDFIELGGQLFKDMDRVLAFEKALHTWAGWVDDNVDPTTSKVFFQGISPSHYNGIEWNEPRAKSCIGQKEPVVGPTYPGGLPPALGVLKKVLGAMRKPVTLLGVTVLSLMRKDGHPSIYGLPLMDCSHWCLPGVPDTWNQILYNLIV